MAEQPRKAAFKIVVRHVERPFSNEPAEELEWICRTLGFFDSDGESPASVVFKEIVRANESGEGLTSTALARHLDMSRGALINHLNNLMRSGLIVREGRYYEPRSRSLFRTIEEIEEDVERIFAKMKRTARLIDQDLGLPETRNE